MNEKKKCWPSAGLIYCDREGTWCASVDITDGSCTSTRCRVNDPEYIKWQQEVEERMKRNHAAHLAEKRAER